MTVSKSLSRNIFIDYLRASAIVLMVIFHFIWDLKYFGHIQSDIPHGPIWAPFRAFIVSCFLFSMGASLVYTYKKGINYKKLVHRTVKLLAASAIITVTTLILMPKVWVYFGILHFIAFASLACVWLVNKPNLSLGLAIVILILYIFTDFPVRWPFIYFDHLLPSYTVDLVTLVPWLGVPLLGIWAAHLQLLQPSNSAKVPQPVLLMSNNSLLIYLVHQPIFFAFLYLYAWLI